MAERSKASKPMVQEEESNFMIKVATFVVDRRNLESIDNVER